MSVRVDQGPEYPGETYIWCDICSPRFNPQTFRPADIGDGLYEGNSFAELHEFTSLHLTPGHEKGTQ